VAAPATDDETGSTPSTPQSVRAFGGATFWDAPSSARDADCATGIMGGPAHFPTPPLATPGTTRSRHVVKPIRGQQPDSVHSSSNASNLSFSLLRTPRGGADPLAARTPRLDSSGAMGAPGLAQTQIPGNALRSKHLADIADADEDVDE
jgi:hypothetical protein